MEFYKIGNTFLFPTHVMLDGYKTLLERLVPEVFNHLVVAQFTPGVDTIVIKELLSKDNQFILNFEHVKELLSSIDMSTPMINRYKEQEITILNDIATTNYNFVYEVIVLEIETEKNNN